MSSSDHERGDSGELIEGTSNYMAYMINRVDLESSIQIKSQEIVSCENSGSLRLKSSGNSKIAENSRMSFFGKQNKRMRTNQNSEDLKNIDLGVKIGN